MAKLRDNRLLWASVLAVILYWVVAPFVPNPYLSIFFSLLILISGTVTMSQYALPTLLVVWHGERSQDEQGRGRGSHLAIYGTFLFAFGCVFMGAYGLWWNAHEQPREWIGSAPSQFGRACLVAGFCLMTVAPSLSANGFEMPSRWWILLVAAGVLIGIGFYLGLQVRTFDTSLAMLLWHALKLG